MAPDVYEGSVSSSVKRAERDSNASRQGNDIAGLDATPDFRGVAE